MVLTRRQGRTALAVRGATPAVEPASSASTLSADCAALEAVPRKKSLLVAFACYIFGGVLGLHHLYLCRDWQCAVWGSTWGLFGLGLVRDFFSLARYVRECNEGDDLLEDTVLRMRRAGPAGPQHGVASARMLGGVLVAWWASFVGSCIPPESSGLTSQWVCAAAGAAFGAHAVGSAPYRVRSSFTASFKAAIGSVAFIAVTGDLGASSHAWTAISAAEGARRSARWRTPSGHAAAKRRSRTRRAPRPPPLGRLPPLPARRVRQIHLDDVAEWALPVGAG